MKLSRTAIAPRRRRPAPVARGNGVQAPLPRKLVTRHIVNHLVDGDELFDAIVFLGHALALPDLLPGRDLQAGEPTAITCAPCAEVEGTDEDEVDDDITDEFAVLLPVLLPVRRAA